MGTTKDLIREIMSGNGWTSAEEVKTEMEDRSGDSHNICTVRNHLRQMVEGWKELERLHDNNRFFYRVR